MMQLLAKGGTIRSVRQGQYQPWSCQLATSRRQRRQPQQQRCAFRPGSNPELEFALLADYAEADILVNLQTSPLGYGLVATEPVSRANTISLPLPSTLTVGAGNVPFLNGYLQDWQSVHGPLPETLAAFLIGTQPPEMRLAGWLLWLRKHGGELWQHYIRLLPAAEDITCLLSFAREEAEQLQLKSLQEEAQEQRDWVKEAHLRMWHPQTGELAGLQLAPSFLDTLWAVSIVKTRSVTLDLDPETGSVALLLTPLVDFANHSFDPSCDFALNEDATSFQVTPRRSLKPGDEVTVAYAPEATNFDLMRDFGFIVPANPHEVVALPQGMELQKRLDGRLLRAALWVRGSFTAGSLQLLDPQAETAPDEEDLFQVDWLRARSALLSLPVDDFGGVDLGPEHFEERELRQQQGLAEALRDTVTKSLEALPTSIVTDEKLLVNWRSLRLSARHRQAILCRLEYKYLLNTIVMVLERYGRCLALWVAGSR